MLQKTLLTVRCPRCHQLMKTAPKKVVSSVKKCVFCGFSFKVHSPGGPSRIALQKPSIKACRASSQKAETSEFSL